MKTHSLDAVGNLVIRDESQATDEKGKPVTVASVTTISAAQIPAHCRDTDFMASIPTAISDKWKK